MSGRGEQARARPVSVAVEVVRASSREWAQRTSDPAAPLVDRRRHRLYTVLPPELERRGHPPATLALTAGSPGRLGVAAAPAVVLSWIVLGILAVALAGGLSGLAHGYRAFTDMSGSMEPVIHTGDVIVDAPLRPADMRVGDVVTFQDPKIKGKLITHRVRALKIHDGAVSVVTRGDANNTVERWKVDLSGELGRVTWRAPHLGYGLAWAQQPSRRLMFIVAPAVLLGLMELVRIWRPKAAA